MTATAAPRPLDRLGDLMRPAATPIELDLAVLDPAELAALLKLLGNASCRIEDAGQGNWRAVGAAHDAVYAEVTGRPGFRLSVDRRMVRRLTGARGRR